MIDELSHSMAHYLLSIHKLKESKGYARVTDIAASLNITKGSVSTAINNLKKREFVVEEENSKFLDLSPLGHQEVHKILTVRTLLFHFLTDFVQVSEETALHDSCSMEHLMSNETREKFFLFMKKISCNCPTTSGQSKKGIKDLDFKTTLDLCGFKDSSEFEKSYINSDLF